MASFEQFDLILDQQFPLPLPPNRQIELVRTKVEMTVRCTACLTRTASLTCSKCWAVKYCSKDCQKMGGLDGKRGWKDHKPICNEISILSKETLTAGEKLVDKIGGPEEFFKSEVVKKGLFVYMGSRHDPFDYYILLRKMLIDAYFWAGRENHGPLAFRLAAENVLDLLCLTYNKMHAEKAGMRYLYCGWMVAGGMCQEAINFLYYFYHREQLVESIPYLDRSVDEDLEGDAYLELMKRKESGSWCPHFWYHDYMLIALIKYKKLQELFLQKQKTEAGWDTFMSGTHQSVGKESVVLMLEGKSIIVEKIKKFVLGDNFRVDQLTEQIQKLLTAVNQENLKIIPGILDKNSIPYPYKDHADEFDVDRHEACVGYDNYASAWNMSPAYSKVLQLFLNTGRVTVYCDEKKVSLPVEGLLQAAFDVDSCDDLVETTEEKTIWFPKNLFSCQ